MTWKPEKMQLGMEALALIMIMHALSNRHKHNFLINLA